MSKNIIVALDGMNRVEAFDLAQRLAGNPHLWGFKGNDLLLEGDPKDTITRFTGLGNFFADYKFHDIPNTVYNEVAKIASYGAALITVHLSGGRGMVREAARAFAEHQQAQGIGIVGVTILTSLSGAEAKEIFNARTALEQAIKLAKIAKARGAWGVVCSPQEVGELSTMPALRGLKFVTPGVRMPGDNPGDQARFDTPKNAIANGADLLVIGRPITGAADPLAALNAIGESLEPARIPNLA